MNKASDGAGNASLTLAFELAAVEAFENPSDVFADARRWSRYVGVVADDADAVESYLAERDLRRDFDPGGRDKWLALADIRETVATDRHVFVGTDPSDRHWTAYAGWEFVPHTEAAEKAGWTLAEETDAATGIVERLRDSPFARVAVAGCVRVVGARKVISGGTPASRFHCNEFPAR